LSPSDSKSIADDKSQNFSEPKPLLQSFKNLSTAKFPEVESVGKGNVVLPSELNFLIIDKVINTKVSSIVYKNGENGYLVEFDIDKSLEKSYQEFRGVLSKAGIVVFGSRSAVDALIDLDGNKYDIRTVFSSIDTAKTNVKIHIILKR
jgi:hypothetical protein